jgi:hypothetical protein
MKACKTFLLVVAVLIFVSQSPGSGAQNVWQDKPYQQWTVSDVEKLLTDSPWAQTRSKGVAIGYDNPVVTGSNNPPSPEAVTLRLRSALPIRQALLRLRQLKAKYDKMSGPDRAAFDDKNKILLECPACAENYVVALGPGPGRGKGVPAIFQSMSLAEAKLSITLQDERGEKRALIHFVPPKVQGDEAVFFFARLNEKGEPLLNQSSKKLIVLFGPQIFNSPVAISKFEFDLPKMLVNGAVDF